jgi:hypothetical protein
MITNLLRELQQTWGYTTEELIDIREKMEELAASSFQEGYNTRNDEEVSYYAGFSAYGKREDLE